MFNFHIGLLINKYMCIYVCWIAFDWLISLMYLSCWQYESFGLLRVSVHEKINIFYTLSVKKLGSSTGRFANATLVRLSEFLSAGYKKGVRPVKDWRTSTIVAIDLMVYSILNVVSPHIHNVTLTCQHWTVVQCYLYHLLCVSWIL